jgi:hypothetical protein
MPLQETPGYPSYYTHPGHADISRGDTKQWYISILVFYIITKTLSSKTTKNLQSLMP